MSKTIVDLVEQDEQLRQILQDLLQAKYLAPGVFRPKAYLIDDERIEQVWDSREQSDELGMIAVGVAIFNQSFHEITARALAGEDPRHDDDTGEWLLEWSAEINERFPDAERLEATAGTLGQYLEFMNRKSQGF